MEQIDVIRLFGLIEKHLPRFTGSKIPENIRFRYIYGDANNKNDIPVKVEVTVYCPEEEKNTRELVMYLVKDIIKDYLKCFSINDVEFLFPLYPHIPLPSILPLEERIFRVFMD
jgi:hypothetical protein